MRSFGLVEDKIYEADFFLDKIKWCIHLQECSYYFSAYISAARSITFAMQASMSGITGFDEWYIKKQEAMRNNALARFFVNVRNESQKLGNAHIRSGKSFVDKFGKVRMKYYFHNEGSQLVEGELAEAKILQMIFDEDDSVIQEDDVATQCEKNLKLILEIVYDCYNTFGPVIDPFKYYTLENIQLLGITIEDAEAKLGFPRGYTDVEGFSDEKRMELLRRYADRCQIDEVFEKYLGKFRYQDEME